MSVVRLFGLGVRTTLDLSGSRADELSRTIRSAWSRCLEPRGEELDGRTLHVSLNHPEENGRSEEGVLAGSNLTNLMQMLTQEVTHSNIATQTGRLLMLHAAAVGNPDTGASLALVAPGGTGKTTLARLLGAEYAYLTDETVGIREDGVILPYEKPLSIRRSPKSWEKDEVSPDALGLRRPVARPRLRSLALIRREPGHRRPKIVEMGVMDALVTLAPETSALSDLPNPLGLFASHLDSVGPALHITYEEAESLLPTFRDVLGVPG
jgi:hypothetical protein